MEKAKAADVHEALPVFEEHLTLMQDLIAPPWRDIICCQVAIDQCYRIMYNL